MGGSSKMDETMEFKLIDVCDWECEFGGVGV